jgi:hypothetical protein
VLSFEQGNLKQNRVMETGVRAAGLDDCPAKPPWERRRCPADPRNDQASTFTEASYTKYRTFPGEPISDPARSRDPKPT